MNKQRNTERSRKLRLIRIVTVELIIMTVSVCVCIMPSPYNLIVPIIIGARSILLKARLYSKSLPMSDSVHYNDVTEPKMNKEKKPSAEAKEKGGGKAVQKTTRTENGKSKK